MRWLMVCLTRHRNARPVMLPLSELQRKLCDAVVADATAGATVPNQILLKRDLGQPTARSAPSPQEGEGWAEGAPDERGTTTRRPSPPDDHACVHTSERPLPEHALAPLLVGGREPLKRLAIHRRH